MWDGSIDRHSLCISTSDIVLSFPLRYQSICGRKPVSPASKGCGSEEGHSDYVFWQKILRTLFYKDPFRNSCHLSDGTFSMASKHGALTCSATRINERESTLFRWMRIYVECSLRDARLNYELALFRDYNHARRSFSKCRTTVSVHLCILLFQPGDDQERFWIFSFQSWR